ncbi:MAG: hypothetical protein AB7U73_00065 [Pirellulales bacterium]
MDDLDFLATLGLTRTGRLPGFFFVMSTAGPHPMILWKVIYYLQWLGCGVSLVWFRVMIGLVQALSGLALFVLLRRYLASRAAAWLGGLLWGVSAIGGWDNPMSVMVGGFIAWGVLWLLLAMGCVTRLADHTGWRWPLLLAACISLTMFSWGILLAVLPALVLQYLLLEHRGGVPAHRLIGWALAWLLPTLFVGALQVSMIVTEMGAVERQREFSAWHVAQGVGGQLSMVAANLVFGHAVSPTVEPLWPKAIWALLLAVAVAMLVRGRALRFLLVVAAMTLVYLTMANTAGSEINLAEVVSSGRYLYIPTLLACCVVAALVERVAGLLPAEAPAWRRGALVAGTATLLLYSAHQYSVARQTRELFDALAVDTTRRLQAQEHLLLTLASEARAAGTTLRVPDLPVVLAPPSHVLWTVSSFAEVMLPGRLAGLEIVPVDRCTATDIEQFSTALGQANQPIAFAWADLLRHSLQDFRSVDWLARYAGRDPAQPLYLPNFYFAHGDVAYPADQVQKWGLSYHEAALVIAADEETYADRLPEAIARLESSTDPAATLWISALRQIARERSRGP